MNTRGLLVLGLLSLASAVMALNNVFLRAQVQELKRQRTAYLSTVDEEFAKHIRHPDKAPDPEALHSGPPDGIILGYNGIEWTWRDTNNPGAEWSTFSKPNRTQAIEAAWAWHDLVWQRARHPFTNSP